jgi:hypothetical protein
MQELIITDLFLIEFNFNYLRMISISLTYFFISWTSSFSSSVSICHFMYSHYLLEHCLHAPEASSSKYCSFNTLHLIIIIIIIIIPIYYLYFILFLYFIYFHILLFLFFKFFNCDNIMHMWIYILSNLLRILHAGFQTD